MSLLEDVFLEDEANEAQELERVIEGDEFDERPRSDSDDNVEREDEAEEDKKRVEPASTKTRRVSKNPRFLLNPARLTGPRGIQVIPEHFKDFKFKGKGHEKEDLDLVLKKLEHWAYRLYPKFKFEDCLQKIETLGKKRPVMVHLQKIRSDQYTSSETVVQKDSSDDEALHEDAPPEDEFDKLLQQQIELARSTPAPNSVKKGMNSSVMENRSLIMPKATSSPSISDEQRERILKSRKLAEERRLARFKNASNANINTQNVSDNITNTPIISNNNNPEKELNSDTGNIIEIEDNDAEIVKKVNRTNVIDSSDEEDCVILLNESVRADVHKDVDNDKSQKSLTEKETNNKKVPEVITDNDRINITKMQDDDVLIVCDNDNDNTNESNKENYHDENVHEVIDNDNNSASVSGKQVEVVDNTNDHINISGKQNNYEKINQDFDNDNDGASVSGKQNKVLNNTKDRINSGKHDDYDENINEDFNNDNDSTNVDGKQSDILEVAHNINDNTNITSKQDDNDEGVHEDFDNRKDSANVNEKPNIDCEILEVDDSSNDRETDDFLILDSLNKSDHETTNNDVNMKSDESPKNKLREIIGDDNTEVEQNKHTVSGDIAVERLSEKPVEVNEEELMDIDFSDDF